MTDTCTITREDPDAPEPVMDPETLEYPDPARIVVYGPGLAPHFGKCRVQIKSAVATSSSTNAGFREGTVQEFEWQGPVVGTEEIAVNDVIHMDTSKHDAALVGREFTVKARHEKSHATMRRLRVIEGTG